ncbi:MAG: hypothetical protein ISR65_02870 [Bacteriovoracaceae bacterium]|nr:hypothetical protein [Bacteriovoracaceae bacterium]
MIFSMIPNAIATIFISLKLATVVTFVDPVTTIIYGGKKSDLFIKKANNDKTVVIKPLGQSIYSNLLILTSKGQYNFYLQSTEHNAHDFIQVSNGKIDSNHRVIVENDNFRVLEGNSSTLFENKLETSVTVNQQRIDGKNHRYLNKGAPIIYQGRRIYH